MEENMQGESSMDEKAFLVQEIRYSKRKQNVKKFLRYESTGIAAGGTIAMVLEGCAVSLFIRCMCGLFWQFYVVRHLEAFIR